jgi:hypothetical protein
VEIAISPNTPSLIVGGPYYEFPEDNGRV